MAAQQQPWALPVTQGEEPTLRIYNSLTKSKSRFVPQSGRHVKWYNCGPTVYDVSHMGHARNYVTQDILRRIMTDYFGYDVHFVMNITDIDDKIIARARQNYLLDQFRAATTALSSDLITQVTKAWTTYLCKQVAEGLPDDQKPLDGQEQAAWKVILERVKDAAWKTDCLKRDEKFDMRFTAANRAHMALQVASLRLRSGSATPADAHKLIDDSRDILSAYLDSQLSATVTDPSISRSLASHYEQLFFADMVRLRVRDPDTLTRVTEFVPEIVSYVQGIVRNGYAYEVEGSVYFDTVAFDGKKGHSYAKLEPWSKGNSKLLQEGEGTLGVSRGRRSPADFALWKASKPGEPSWPSPWGAGRPGWHIECSAMASAVFGDNMDIHSGGVDLAFPHHDNEMAQAEAYHECHSWVNYFIHTGHLHIEGLKMSKSLKNFITIDEILQKYTARQLRLAFLTQLWNTKMDFSESMMTGEVKSVEATINNFFTNVKAVISRGNTTESSGHHNYESDEIELTKRIQQAQAAFRAALCDSFNTSEALDILRELVSRVNVYINAKGRNLNVGVVEHAAGWVGRMLRMFGLGEGESTEIGWGQEIEGGGNIQNREEVLMPYLRTLSSFRDGVRRLAMSGGDGTVKDILYLCDKLRDSDLVTLGVALDDQEDGQALVKLVSPSELIKARDEKRAQAELKTAKKAAAVEAEREKYLQKMEKGRVAPADMFKPPYVPEGMYGSWSITGLPLTDGEGKELSKNQVKKTQKEWAAQKKLHEEFLTWSRERQG